jgi:uncharacterized membrane protein
MTDTRNISFDEKLESTVVYVLRAGVFISAALVLSGGIYYLSGNAPASGIFHKFDTGTLGSRDLAGIVKNISEFNSYGIIQLGLLVLIATPVMRVLFSLVTFILQKDRVYVTATLVVIAVISYSLFFSR